MDKKSISREIIKNVGGHDNIENVTNCYTRLRFSLKNNNLVDKEAIKVIDGVHTILEDENQYHLVLLEKVDAMYQSLMNELKELHVVITGAGSGLGASLAKKYNEKGYYVTLIGRTRKKLEKVAKTFKNSNYSIYTLDVSSFNDVENTFKQIDSEVQSIDILVNNAGVGYFDLTEDLTSEQVDQMIDINLKGTIFCTQQVIGDMKERDAGSIINVISTAGVEGKVTESAYSASKFGARGFTESIIKELQDTNVQAHAIYMGGMKTPFWAETMNEADMEGMMEPDDIADIILANTKERPHISVPEVIIKNR